jgi:hypothetical protein
MLGQALMASPLPLDEINAILLMSVYSNQSPVMVCSRFYDIMTGHVLIGV